MRVEVLISTMHQNNLSVAGRCNCKSDVLIINQTDHEGYDEEVIEGHTVRMYSTKQRGLSRSRNMALIHAKGDICLICDEDEILQDDYVDTILNAYKRIPNADIIAFDFIKNNQREEIKNKFGKEGKAPRLTFYSSVSLSFRREEILKHQIFFDIRLGTGSGFISAGEEGAWQQLAKTKGLSIYQSPNIIASVDFGESSWFKGYNEKYFYDLGANLCVKFPKRKYLFMLYYVWRLNKKTSLSLIKQLRCLRAGIKGFPKDLSYDNYIQKYKI